MRLSSGVKGLGWLSFLVGVHADMVSMELEPFSDHQCSQPVGWRYDERLESYGDGDVTHSNKPFSLGIGPTDSPFGFLSRPERYIGTTFAGYVDGEPQEISRVWWKIPQPDPGCRVIVMKGYRNNMDYGIATSLPGSVVLNAESGGCAPMDHLGPEQNILMTWCCGEGHCSHYAAQSRALGYQPEGRKRDLSHETAQSPQTGSYSPTGSLAARAKSSVSALEVWNSQPVSKRQEPVNIGRLDECTTRRGESRIEAGPQKAASDLASCAADAEGECSDTMTMEQTWSMEISSSQTFEYTNSVGHTVEVNAGVQLELFNFGASSSTSTEFSQSVSNESGQSESYSQMLGMEQSRTPARGQNAIMSYTPTFECVTVHFDCGEDRTFETESCQAIESSPEGEYNYIYLLY